MAMKFWLVLKPVPKRLRYFMQRDGAVLSMVLRIFLRVIAQTLQTHSPGAAHMDKAAHNPHRHGAGPSLVLQPQ